jgi:hypothetical protein
MRPSIEMMPRTKLRTASQATSGVGWTMSSLIDRMSDTASTRRPTVRSPACTTMNTLRTVGSITGMPRRQARSMIGSTAPRRLITPRM